MRGYTPVVRRRSPIAALSVLSAVVVLAGLLTAIVAVVGTGRAGASTVAPPANCTPQMNAVQCENIQPGTPTNDSPMSISYTNPGDATIQGFATSQSVDVGQSVSFKVDAPTVSAWHINIFRMGYYQGLGSREWASNIQPSVSLPQAQPPCDINPGGQVTGLIDCGNWAVSASWQVPSYAVSGLYVALLIRDDVSRQRGERGSLRGPQRRQHGPGRVPDVGCHLAGLQRLQPAGPAGRHHQPGGQRIRRRATTSTSATSPARRATPGGYNHPAVRGLLQPTPAGRRISTRAGTGPSTPSSR